MFNNTLRKLTVLNSVVFLVIFVIFGAIVYGYVAFRLFDKVDDSMRYKAAALKIVNGRPTAQVRNRALFDPRIFILLRGTDGRIISPYTVHTEETEHLSELTAQVKPGRLLVREVEDHVYRIISVPYQYEENVIQTDRGLITVQEVIAVSIVDSEVALLKNLLLIIVSGLVTGVLIILLAGYYLARRAMIPIQQAWEKQQQFVADASHELRSPIAVVKSNAELILRHPDHTVKEEGIRITNIIRETMRMTRLVASLLTLARADANQAELQLAPVNLNEVVAAAIEQFQPVAELKGIPLQLNLQDELWLLADKERLHQLLVILLDNALKYTPASGRILLSCQQQADSIAITVADTGYGIAPEDLPRIFDRFFRGDKARSREDGGTGLGLAIAKWIVEKHGGKIEAESQMGKGTRFNMVFPVKLK